MNADERYRARVRLVEAIEQGKSWQAETMT